MTVSSEISTAGPFIGNGSTTVFPYGFKITSEEHIRVTIIGTDGQPRDLSLPGGDYLVTGVGDESGGDIVKNSPLVTGETLSIRRDPPFTQETSLANQGPYYPEVVEDRFDMAVMQAQALKDVSDRSVTVAIGVPPIQVTEEIGDGRTLMKMGSALVAGPDIVAESVRATNAADIAAGYASDAVSQGNVPIYATIVGMSAISVPVGINAIRVNGQQTASDGLGGLFYRSPGEPSSNRKFQSAGGVWWDFVLPLLYPGGRKNLGDVIRKSRAGNTISIAFYGDSIFYGQDTVSAGLLPPANGAAQTRSPNPMPETLSNALFFSDISANVINRSFPGDNTRLGISRWAAAGSTDVAFIMYGHNDANNYGAAGVVPVDEYRRNLGFIIERELAKGAAVVVFGPPPVFARNEDKVLRGYVSAARRVAEQYGLPFIDLGKQLASIYDPDVNPTGLMWTDGVHLSPAAYVECGAHLAALFTHGETVCRASPGAEYFVEDRIFDEWASTYRQNPDSASGWTHYLVALPQNTSLSIACEVEDDCIPVVTMVNATGASRSIKLYYAQGLYTSVRNHTADSSAGLRSRVKGPKLRRGLRLLHVRNESADIAYIESIKFERLDSVATSRGVYRKSELSGACAPSVNWFSGVWWAARDDTALLPRGAVIETRMMLPHDTVSGISLMKSRDVADDYLSSDQIMVLRSGTNLIVRKLVAGVATDTTVAAVFTSGQDFVGCVTLQVGSDIKASVDGVLKATVASPNINAGYAAILSLGISRMRCDAMTILQ